MPWLTVVVPTLNEAAGIEACLAPLQSWRARGVEVLLVDGGSDDDTVRRAAPLVDQVVTSPRGRALQLNAGAARASAPDLLFLHADTLVPDAALAQLSERAPLQGWGRFDVSLRGDHRFLPVIAWSMNLRSRLTGIATGDQALFVSTRLFEAVGGFPRQPLMEDVELSARLRRCARPLNLRTRVSVSARRWLTHGVLRTVVLMWWLRWRYFCGADAAQLHRIYYR